MNADIIGQFAVLALLVAGGLLIYQLKRSWRRRHWIPVTGTISTYKTGTICYDEAPNRFFVTVTYTYKIKDKMYWGEFQEIVEDEPAAQHVLDRFPKGNPIALLHHPKRPELSCRSARPPDL
jgi:hypothetical protein